MEQIALKGKSNGIIATLPVNIVNSAGGISRANCMFIGQEILEDFLFTSCIGIQSSKRGFRFASCTCRPPVEESVLYWTIVTRTNTKSANGFKQSDDFIILYIIKKILGITKFKKIEVA